MHRLSRTAVVAGLMLSILAATGCGDSAGKDKDPSTKPGTNLGSKDIKQSRPNAGGGKGTGGNSSGVAE